MRKMMNLKWIFALLLAAGLWGNFYPETALAEEVVVANVCPEQNLTKKSPLPPDVKTLKPNCISQEDFVFRNFNDGKTELYTYKDGRVTFSPIFVREVFLYDADMKGEVRLQKADDSWVDFVVDASSTDSCGNNQLLPAFQVNTIVKAIEIQSNHLDKKDGTCKLSGRADSTHVFLVKENTSNPPTPTPSKTNTPVTSTATNTSVPPTATSTKTNTPIPPTSTPTATNTALPTSANTPAPTAIGTIVSTPTNTQVPPTATPTNTSTNTIVPPTATATNTPLSTATDAPPSVATSTATSTATPTPPLPPTATPTQVPMPQCISFSKEQEENTVVVRWILVVSGTGTWRLSELDLQGNNVVIEEGFITSTLSYEHEVVPGALYSVYVLFDGKTEADICGSYKISPTGEIERPEPAQSQVFLPLVARKD